MRSARSIFVAAILLLAVVLSLATGPIRMPLVRAARQSTPVQPTGLTAFHRSGQTFLTWDERSDLSGERYHVYRHTAPITAANLASAQKLTATWGALPEGSSIYWTEHEHSPVIQTNYMITDVTAGGTALADTTGLFVWTTHDNGTFYYAVTTVSGGVENTSTFNAGNSLATGIVETVADPKPILVWQSASGRGRVYTQFMDYATYNPTFDAPRGTAHQLYAYNYSVSLPPGYNGIDPLSLTVYMEGWGGRYLTDENGCPPCGWGTIFVAVDDPHQTWHYGHSATYDYRSGGTASTGPIVNYTEERILRAVYDISRDPAYHVDTNRIFAYGQSMGGSGALSLGVRYPNVFAAIHAGEPMTNYRAADGSGGTVNWLNDTEPKWGTVATNLPIENRGRYASALARYNGTGVWDWQNHQAQLVTRRTDDTAIISLDHGNQDSVIAWASQGQPAYAPFYQSRRAFSGGIADADHTWLGFLGLGPTVGDVGGGPFRGFSAVKNETVPALTYGSGSLPVPPTGAGGYNQTLEWSASWDNWDRAPIDTATQWGVSLRTTNGSSQTVDVTPRRLQNFAVVPSAQYTWENRRVSDNGLVASGVVTADSDGLVTVPNFAVSATGNRLILQPAGGSPPTATPTLTSTPTPTATPTASSQTPTPSATLRASATPTPTQSPVPNPQSLILQNGVSPTSAYTGTTDSTITTWGSNTYANLGGWDYLQVGETESADEFRLLVRFELAGWLPANIQVNEAWLELCAFNSEYDDGPHDVVAHRVTQAWVEGNGWDLWADGRNEGVTWVTARPGVNWATPGGDFDAAELDRVTVAANPNGWYRWNVTSAVRAWVNGTAPNYGLLLEPDNGPWLHHQFRSSEYNDPAFRPRLVIAYQPTCPADVNHDGVVDIVDIQMVAAWWQRTGFPPEIDLNGDGVVDILDIMIVVAQWGQPCGAVPTVTPTATTTTTATRTPTATPALSPTPSPTVTPTGQASGARPLPDTTASIYVWNDQLATNSMSEAQFQFAATHYVGSQKITRSQADRLRAYNPNFLILHYRLGDGLGYRAIQNGCQPTGDWLAVIEGDNWVQEWPGDANVQENWFYHYPEGGNTRVLNCDWGWYLMELDNASWRAYWRDEVRRQLAVNDDDGIFMDSLSVPNYLGYNRYMPNLPAVDSTFEAAWATRIQNWLAWLQSQMGSAYLIPNVGAWVTSRETTDYSIADGVMIEGFAEWGPDDPFDVADWQLQMNRTLNLERQSKVIIAQNYLYDAADVNTRLFYLANYLLVKGVHSFINMDLGLEPEWFPEYEIPIGSPVGPLPTDIDGYLDPSGLYRRDYTNGLALVNPGTVARTIELGSTYYLATPSGGGWVPDDGDTSAWTVSYAPVTSVTLAPNRGAILLVRPYDLHGDLDGDGDVDIADIMLVAAH